MNLLSKAYHEDQILVWLTVLNTTMNVERYYLAEDKIQYHKYQITLINHS